MSNYFDNPTNAAFRDRAAEADYLDNPPAACGRVPPSGNSRYPPESHGICGRNSHYFGCIHESRCYCGLTGRLPLEVDEGL